MYSAKNISIAAILVTISVGCTGGGPGVTEQLREQADPKAIEFIIMAEDAVAMGALRPALAMADSALAYAPELPDTYYIRGVIFTELTHFDEARRAYEEVAAIDPHYPGVYLNLGNNALRQGQYNQAIEYFEKERAEDSASRLLTSKAFAYGQIGETEKAVELFKSAIEADTTSPTAYMRLGQLLKDEGELEEALKYSRQGLEMAPDNTNYQYTVGSLLLLKGEAEESVELLHRVVQTRPGDYWATSSLGRALVRAGRQEEGEYYLSRADSLQELVAEVEHWQGRAKSSPDDPQTWVNLGSAHYSTGNIEEAIEALEVAVFLVPNHVAIENNLANLYLENGQTDRAIGRYQSILHRNPRVPDVWLNLGVAFAELGHFSSAREAWETGLQFSPDNAELREFLAALPEGY